jgi:hypothetical protein
LASTSGLVSTGASGATGVTVDWAKCGGADREGRG